MTFERRSPFKPGDRVRHRLTKERGTVTALNDWYTAAYVIFDSRGEGHMPYEFLELVPPLEQLAECAE